MSNSGSDIPYLDLSSSLAPQFFQSSADPISLQKTLFIPVVYPQIISEPILEQEDDLNRLLYFK